VVVAGTTVVVEVVLVVEVLDVEEVDVVVVTHGMVVVVVAGVDVTATGVTGVVGARVVGDEVTAGDDATEVVVAAGTPMVVVGATVLVVVEAGASDVVVTGRSGVPGAIPLVPPGADSTCQVPLAPEEPAHSMTASRHSTNPALPSANAGRSRKTCPIERAGIFFSRSAF